MTTPDDGIRRVLERAAQNDEFAKTLLRHRAAALAEMDLTPAERDVLLAASKKQLRGMIEQAKKRPWYRREMSVVTTLGLGLAAAGGIYAIAVPNMLGHTTPTVFEMKAVDEMVALLYLEREYHKRHGRYLTLDEMVQEGVLSQPLNPNARYGITIYVESDCCFLIARDRVNRHPIQACDIGGCIFDWHPQTSDAEVLDDLRNRRGQRAWR